MILTLHGSDVDEYDTELANMEPQVTGIYENFPSQVEAKLLNIVPQFIISICNPGCTTSSSSITY